ncbi:MAG TPA: hypothetical protein GX717_04960 [Clostridiaceae bacterium]|jgi:hypothetical protein|nr:hypothetical protein [Clostridiaceae bacterium]
MKAFRKHSLKVLSGLLICTIVACVLSTTALAAFVEFTYSGSDANGRWKVSEFNDSATGNQFLYVYTDCWKKPSGLRYHEHIMMTKGSTAIRRLTVVVQPVFYSTGAAIGSQRRYDAYNATRLRVMPQAVNSGGSTITLFATLESQHTTATYTYHNMYGV